MKELNRTRRLIFASILFVLIILVGLLTFRTPEFEYKISTIDLVNEMFNPNNEITPEEAVKLVDDDQTSTVFVDLRNPYLYTRGFIGQAINIPVSDILDNESIAFFHQMQNDSILVVLYSSNQLEANGQWMLLKQLGFNNLKVLLGGYDYFVNQNKDYPELTEAPSYRTEEPLFDYVAFFEEAGDGSNKSEITTQEPVSVEPVKRKKKTTTAGGC